jgi:hypothetical protein
MIADSMENPYIIPCLLGLYGGSFILSKELMGANFTIK